ncbi:MAG: hypothetical protein ABSA93_02950 [Streptosporangiaceae bacterium]
MLPPGHPDLVSRRTTGRPRIGHGYDLQRSAEIGMGRGLPSPHRRGDLVRLQGQHIDDRAAAPLAGGAFRLAPVPEPRRVRLPGAERRIACRSRICRAGGRQPRARRSPAGSGWRAPPRSSAKSLEPTTAQPTGSVIP